MSDKLFITEITENDFRKLDLKVFDSFGRVSVLNDLLDTEIEAIIQMGFEHGDEELIKPLIVAIAKEGKRYYFDRYIGKCPYAMFFGYGKPASKGKYYVVDDKKGIKIDKRITERIYLVHLNPRLFQVKTYSVREPDPDWDGDPQECYILKRFDVDTKTGKETLIDTHRVKNVGGCMEYKEIFQND